MKLEQRTAKIIQTPAEALQTLLDKYQITAKRRVDPAETIFRDKAEFKVA